jgi:TPR repeat protein
MRTISADQSIDAAPLHIEGLSLLRKLAEPNPGAGIVGQRVAARASALLDAYRQETERSIGTRRAEARTRAAALTKIGDARGHYWLGQAYDFGVGGGRDLTAAYEEYSSAVRLGVSEAEKTREQLVKKMLVADQRAKDVAYRHLESQAQAGDSNAQVWLGYRYKNGDGIEKDLERARYWYERAAGQDANWPAKKQALLALQDLEKARHTNQKTK